MEQQFLFYCVTIISKTVKNEKEQQQKYRRQKIRFARKTLFGVRQTFRLAQKVGKRLGKRQILQR